MASVSSDVNGIEQATVAVKGRCSRLAHMVKTEIRENPIRYSQDDIQYLNEVVQKLESSCKNECCALDSETCYVCTELGISVTFYVDRISHPHAPLPL